VELKRKITIKFKKDFKKYLNKKYYITEFEKVVKKLAK
jgi:mRNA-degrading endonuclease YafQ of YafQ-DinJ toxin-antitoxin module